MIRHLFIAALRNMAANRLLSAISILGLSVGICAALLMSLVIRNQLTYDRFIPGYERTYLGVLAYSVPGHPTQYAPTLDDHFVALSRLKFPQIEAITRIVSRAATLRRGQVEDAKESIYWVDPNFFNVLPLPVYAGHLQSALARPDGIVLTRSAARKYFGRDDPVGETIQVTTRQLPRASPVRTKADELRVVADAMYRMTVTAVINDLPTNGTQLDWGPGIFASGLAPISAFNFGKPEHGTSHNFNQTFLRLVPGASIERLKAAMPAFMLSNPTILLNPSLKIAPYDFVRIDKVNLHPGLNPRIGGLLTMTALTGALILFIACINFVNLSTARFARRALEVGMRKVTGAGRGALILQFLVESLVYVLIATVIAIALAELLLPYLNAVLKTGAVFDYWRDPMLVAELGIAILLLGVLAGLYPAFVLSAFKPVTALKGPLAGSHKSNVFRQVLVTAQFAILLGLAIAAIVVYQQREYATQEALRVATDQVLLVRNGIPSCSGALMTEWRALPGVRGAYCGNLLQSHPLSTKLKDGTLVSTNVAQVDAGLLELFGLEPRAGRFFRTASNGQGPLGPCQAVINETAVRRLGYTSPDAAIGQILDFQHGQVCKGTPVEIIGVVQDFTLGSVVQPIDALIYVNDHAPYGGMNTFFKLAGHDIPETLAAIDRVWIATGQTETGQIEPLSRMFLNNYIQNLYLSIQQEAQVFAASACIAILLACLGLIGIAVSTAERRTKEIGIRKAMGATSAKVVLLLLFQFARPVLWANAIAWPAAWWAMHRWLSGFVYHVELQPWLFLAASAVTLLVALLTVAGQAMLVAREKPVLALRYE